MEKIDLRKQFKSLYSPSAKQIELVDVPVFQYATISGIIPAHESPGTSAEFADAMQALYGISYTLKFMSKLSKENPADYTVMALEARWWVEHDDFEFGKKQEWLFSAMIMQPDLISSDMFSAALEKQTKKKPSPAASKLKLEKFAEGSCVQVMHLGPYSSEPATIDRMKAFMKENHLVRNGHHHEIYLGDPRKSTPEKLKTILRQPVRAA